MDLITAQIETQTMDTTTEADLLSALLAETEHIDEKPTFGTDADSLAAQTEHLRLELSEAYSNGSIDDCLRIKGQLDAIPLQIRKAQIAQAKADIEAETDNLAETQILIDDARALRAEQNKILADAIREYEEAGNAVQKVEFLLWQLNTQLDNSRASIRHNKRLLQELIEPTGKGD